MITFLIISVLIGIINVYTLYVIDTCFLDKNTGEFVSIFSWKAPVVAKVFIILMFIPIINIPFFILSILDYFNGEL